MRRADRLFQIVQLIRGRRLTTAAFLAQRLEVSERTVYRDVADLQRQGVPIEGEAGVGYRLGAGFDLPPLMFSHDEARALVASVRMAQVWQDPALAQASQVALGKILSVLPLAARVAAQSMAIYAPPVGLEPAVPATLQTLREAAQAHRKLQFSYTDAAQAESQRTVRPPGLLLLGQRVDAGGLVRTACGLSQLPAGPYRAGAYIGRNCRRVSGRGRQDIGRLLAPGCAAAYPGAAQWSGMRGVLEIN